MEDTKITSNKVTLVILPSEKRNFFLSKIAKEVAANKSTCYVTLNKTADALRELFQKNKVNLKNIVFVDTISRSLKATPNQTEGCYFLDQPQTLNELDSMIDRFLVHEFEYLIFDSLTDLLVYSKGAAVAKFLNNLVKKIRQGKTKAIFYVTSVTEQTRLITKSSKLVDKVVEFDRKI